MNHSRLRNDLSPCILCGATTGQYLYPSAAIVACTGCGLVRADDIPDESRLTELYSESYFRSDDSGALGYDDYIADREKISRTFRKRLREIEKQTGRKGKLLDVGCATGFSLDIADQLGWEATGIEISAFACEFARRHMSVDILCGSLAQAEFAPESFDVVTMWDFIEHCPDPSTELAHAHRLLKPGGLLALTTPNISSIPARIWGARWMGIKQGEHLYYFSPATMKRLLSKHHFVPIRVKHVGKYIDVDFFIRRTGQYSKKVQRLLSRASRWLGVSEAIMYINPFDIMLVYARKASTAE